MSSAMLCLVLSAHALAESGDETSATRAVAVGTSYVSDTLHQAHGGLSTGTRHLQRVDLTFEADSRRGEDRAGTTFFADLQYNNGSASGDPSGSIQGISSIEAEDSLRLYELWLDHELASRNTTIRFGLLDVNSAFDAIDSAALFINPSHGMAFTLAQSGEGGPSTWPVTSLGIQVTRSFERCSVRGAVLDGVPGDPQRPSRTAIKLSSRDGALLIGEIDCGSESAGRVGIGYWQYTSEFESSFLLDGDSFARDDNSGAYVLAESPLFFSQDEQRGVRLFGRIGSAQQRVNAVDTFFAAGAVLSTSFTQFTTLDVGLAAAIAHLGNPARTWMTHNGVRTASAERNYELTFRIGVTESLAVQADIQHIEHPGMDRSIRDGWVAGLRFELATSWTGQD